MKRKSIKTLKNKLTALLHPLIRERDADKPCISCGKRQNIIQAGHFVKCKHLPTRWHPWNINGECEGCNFFDTSHIVGYYIELEQRYGSGTGEHLFRLARVVWQPEREQLERLILACTSPEDYESEWFAVQREFAPEFEMTKVAHV